MSVRKLGLVRIPEMEVQGGPGVRARPSPLHSLRPPQSRKRKTNGPENAEQTVCLGDGNGRTKQKETTRPEHFLGELSIYIYIYIYIYLYKQMYMYISKYLFCAPA